MEEVPRGTLLVLLGFCLGNIRDGKTTIKIRFAVLRGGGAGHREHRGKSFKTLFFVGNATTIEF